MADTKRLVLDLRGGRNGTDPAISLAGSNQCVEALNVDWYAGLIARKRNGATALTMTGGTAIAVSVRWLKLWYPGGASWGLYPALILLDGATRFKLFGGTAWSDLTHVDSIQSSHPLTGASLNGKLFLAFNSDVDRLHVYDQNLSTIRRVGLATPSAPTVANTGSGSYAATIRYYRQRTCILHSTIIDTRSEPSASASFTPSGSGTHARVTYVSTGVEAAATHWEIEASANNVTFYRLARQAVASTTYDDNLTPSTYDDGAYTESAESGAYTAPTSVKWLLSDGNRLLMAGGYESGAAESRVWFTPVLGTTDEGDDERISNTATQKNWINVSDEGSGITGLAGPLSGTIIVWSRHQTWKLIPTGDVNTPYLARLIMTDVGCISQNASAMGLDEQGSPALYWLDGATGAPWRLGARGLQYLGRDNEDVWSTCNVSQVYGFHVLAFPGKHQVWFHVSTGSNALPNLRMVFDWQLGKPDAKNHVRGGWAKHTTALNSDHFGWSSALYSATPSATPSLDLKPYSDTNGATVYGWDTGTDDAGTVFQSYVKFPLSLALGFNHEIGQSQLIAKAAAGVTITQTIDRDFGLETRTSTVSIAAAASETHVYKEFEASQLSGVGFCQIQLGDASAVSNAWTLDGLIVPVTTQEPR